MDIMVTLTFILVILTIILVIFETLAYLDNHNDIKIKLKAKSKNFNQIFFRLICNILSK